MGTELSESKESVNMYMPVRMLGREKSQQRSRVITRGAGGPVSWMLYIFFLLGLSLSNKVMIKVALATGAWTQAHGLPLRQPVLPRSLRRASLANIGD